MTIGLMILALLMSLIVVLLRIVGVDIIGDAADELLSQIDFSKALLGGMLGYMLFANALQIHIKDLRQRRWEVLSFATISTVLSALIVGSLLWGVVHLMGLDIDPLYCFIFGVLISPTDPIAVLSVLKTTKAPRMLRVTIAGESLLNDGVSVVLFVALLDMLNGQKLSLGAVTGSFLLEAIGGGLLGLALGFGVYQMLKSVHDYKTEILMTIALATASYTFATMLHLSGVIAAVAAGLVIGNYGKLRAMSVRTREHLDNFWDLIDECLNGILFVLVGLEILIVRFHASYLLVGLAAIVIVLLARLVSVWIPFNWFKLFSNKRYSRGALAIMTWGGLRGGIPIALALLIPRSEGFDLVLTATYIVVAFSIIVQGLTIKKLLAKFGY